MRLYSRFTLTVILVAGFGANAQDVAFGYQQGSKGNGPCNSRLQRSPVPLFVLSVTKEKHRRPSLQAGKPRSTQHVRPRPECSVCGLPAGP
jgi:hypothetical protein